MSDKSKIEPVTDEALEDAAGGQTPIHPGGSGVASSGPENDIGNTMC